MLYFGHLQKTFHYGIAPSNQFEVGKGAFQRSKRATALCS